MIPPVVAVPILALAVARQLAAPSWRRFRGWKYMCKSFGCCRGFMTYEDAEEHVRGAHRLLFKWRASVQRDIRML